MKTERCHILPLRAVLHRFLEAEGAVPATLTVDSGKPGPKLAIIACTHGNEPVGLAAFEYLLSDLALSAGSLTFIIGNPKAAECYFDAECDDSKQASRYTHANLNRLPEGDGWEASQDYEYQRAAQLKSVLQSMDGVLDLHSTSSDAPPMLICIDQQSTALVQDALFPFEHIISQIHHHLRGCFLIELAEQASLKMLAECGQHECLTATQNAIDISLAFLHAMGAVEASLPRRPEQTRYEYQVKQAVFLPDCAGSYRLVRQVEPFEFVEKGQILAADDAGHECRSPEHGYAIMCPQTMNTLDSSEALLFLCDRKF